MTPKIAQEKHIEGILGLIQEFVEESAWGWTYNREHSLDSIHRFMRNFSSELLVLEDAHGDVAGFSVIAWDSDFHDERCGHIVKFYIRKKSRGKLAGIKLAESVIEWFDFCECVDSFAADTGNIPGQGKSFTRLFKKLGYEEHNGALVRRNPSHGLRK